MRSSSPPIKYDSPAIIVGFTLVSAILFSVELAPNRMADVRTPMYPQWWLMFVSLVVLFYFLGW